VLPDINFEVQRWCWTDLRMTYEGYPERQAAQGVLSSNWEI